VTRYEILRSELGRLRIRRAVALLTPAGVAAFFITSFDSFPASMLAGLATFVLLPLALNPLWRMLFSTYREWSERSLQISTEVAEIRGLLTAIFDKYPKRRKGEQFKRAYDLSGKPLRNLEEALSVGMCREQREVFVTVFMRGGMSVRVTASIGSPFRCSASDNPTRWKDHARRLKCDEIRQYHNHPVHNGVTRPSPTDIRTSESLNKLLGQQGAKLRSFIIFWNSIREWKVLEYDSQGRHWLHFEFDASS